MNDTMAFWQYDRYPYLLCGTITAMREDGLVKTKEFGQGSLFRPVLILPIDTGLKLKSELERLEQEHIKETKELLLKSKEKLAEITKVYNL